MGGLPPLGPETKAPILPFESNQTIQNEQLKKSAVERFRWELSQSGCHTRSPMVARR
jgi:hypothetical protein